MSMTRLLDLLATTDAWQAGSEDPAEMLAQLGPEQRAEADAIIARLEIDLYEAIARGFGPWAD